MIREDYCSYEVAKLLKEKGFPQDTYPILLNSINIYK